jgi:DNA-binding CsgD family transcriptional regulator
MSQRVRSKLPPVLPAHLSQDECVARLAARVGWTKSQAQVALAGISGQTCVEIAALLGIADSTVRAHQRDSAAWIDVHSREAMTARVVATLWQSVIEGMRGGSAEPPSANGLGRSD